MENKHIHEIYCICDKRDYSIYFLNTNKSLLEKEIKKSHYSKLHTIITTLDDAISNLRSLSYFDGRQDGIEQND
jgi:hypothetical protein